MEADASVMPTFDSLDIGGEWKLVVFFCTEVICCQKEDGESEREKKKEKKRKGRHSLFGSVRRTTFEKERQTHK